jgi:D-alanyl-D-alanine carboxypeptidase
MASLAVASVLSLVVVVGPVRATSSTVVSPSGSPLPDCQFGNTPVAYQDYGDWQKTMVDTDFALPRSYVPPDMVPVRRAGIGGSAKVRALVIDDLRALAAAARAAGNPIAVQSGYRSYATQASTFNGWVAQLGYDMALKVSAQPGHSEHQLGLAIDFKSKGGKAPWNYADWGKTAAGRWMSNDAWEYGFVLSYPKGVSQDVTCYRWEPWHYRYVGRDLAAAIHQADLTTREYMWQQGDGEPGSGADFAPGTSTVVVAAPSAVVGSQQLTKTRVPLSITWSSDDQADVSSYTLQQSVNGGSWQTLTLASLTDTSVTLMSLPGQNYSYRVLATDTDGGQSNWALGGTVALDMVAEKDDALSYSGDWIAGHPRSAFGHHLRYTQEAGASVSYTFSGSSIAWVAQEGPRRGEAQVYVDDSLVATVDTYNPTRQPRSVAFSQAWNEVGVHTIIIVNQGTANRPRVDLDGFIVTH